MSEGVAVPEMNDPRSGVGKAPLPDGAQSEEFRDGELFEELEAEFRKMEVDGPSAVNWKSLNEKTLTVLAEHSKDLVLATRLAYGLYIEEGYGGLAVGTTILKDISSDFWETMVPPVRRERGRAGAYDWFAEKVAGLVEAQPPAAGDLIKALWAHDALVDLDNVLEQKFTKSSAALGPLIRALRPFARDARSALEEEARKKAEAEAAASSAQAAPPPATGADDPKPEAGEGSETPASPAPASPPAVPAPSAPPSSSVPAPEIATNAPPSEGLQSLFNAASKIATGLRQQNASDPSAYQCSRFGLWGRIKDLPPNQGGKTMLPPPQKTKIQELAALKGAGNNEGLLHSAESAFVSSPFWLDAQRHLHEAMSALGDTYAPARLAIEGELAAFLKRCPEVTDLSFSDGTPFADAATRAWISETVASGGGGAGSGGDEAETKASEAAALMQAGKVVEGLSLMNAYIDTCGQERDWFRAQAKLGELCLRFEVMAPLFALSARLMNLADERGLSRWEPDLVVSVCRVYWQALHHKNVRQFVAEADVVSLKNRVMETLSILDMGVAAELTGKK